MPHCPGTGLAVANRQQQQSTIRFLLGGVPVTFDDDTADAFARLHKVFTFHLGVAVGLSWMTAVYAASNAPWVRNIRPLIDPASAGHVESTWSFLFGLPAVLAIAWLVAFFGRDVLRHFQLMKNQTVEFALSGAAAFMIFYLSIDRAVAAILLVG